MVSFFPIVGRELRVASRRRMTYWSRFGTALIALGAFIWVWITIARTVGNAQRGMMLFSIISGAAFIFALVAGAAITADCISEEKREGTLGLLFLTDLRGYDVVFGKLFATSIDSFYRLVAVFPILAIPVMMGGVTPQEVGRVVLVLLNTLFLSLSVGIFFSTLSREDRKARGMTISFLLGCTIGVPVGAAMWVAYFDLRSPNLDVMVASPGYGFFSAFAVAHKPHHYWGSLGLFHGIAWVALVVSSLVLPRAWQDKARTKWSERMVERWKTWCHGAGDVRKTFRAQLLNVNAVYWLASRDRIKPMMVWLFLGVSGAFWLWLYTRWPDEMLEPEVYITTSMLVNTLLKFWVGSEAPRLFSRDKKSGALELLLSTPMSVKTILNGQLLGFWRHFGWPVTVVFGLEIVMMTASLASDFDREGMMLWFVGLTMFVADLFALAWLGMWQGLKARNPNTASGNVLARILLLPWFIFFSLLTFYELADLDRAINLDMDEEGAMLVWFAIGMAVNAWFIYSSRHKLLVHFREIAMERFQPKKWRWFGWFRARA